MPATKGFFMYLQLVNKNEQQKMSIPKNSTWNLFIKKDISQEMLGDKWKFCIYFKSNIRN